MKKQKFKKYDVLEITWLDSHSSGGWKIPSDIEKWIDNARNDFNVKTVGYYFQEDDDFLRICQGHDNQSATQESKEDNKDALFAVAKSCIKSIRVLK